MMWEGRLRHLGHAPVDALQAIVPSISEAVWLNNPFRQKAFDMHRQTRSLIFRYLPGDDPSIHHDLPLWFAWRGLLQPILSAATESFAPGRCCRILLASLPPGGEITPHRDVGRSYELTHRLHVPIQTDPQVGFHIGGEDYHLESGQIYEINNLLVHAVTNKSDVDRVHLIVNYLEEDAPSTHIAH